MTPDPRLWAQVKAAHGLTKSFLPQPLSLLLKLSPLVDELALYDVVNTPGVAADLSHISSQAVCLVKFDGVMPNAILAIAC